MNGQFQLGHIQMPSVYQVRRELEAIRRGSLRIRMVDFQDPASVERWLAE